MIRFEAPPGTEEEDLPRLLSPERLAWAGLYYTPDKDSDDKVTCFCCNFTASGWAVFQDPVFAHYEAEPPSGKDGSAAKSKV